MAGRISGEGLMQERRRFARSLGACLCAAGAAYGCASDYDEDDEWNGFFSLYEEEEDEHAAIKYACDRMYAEKKGDLGSAWTMMALLPNDENETSRCYFSKGDDEDETFRAVREKCEQDATARGQDSIFCQTYRDSTGYAYYQPYDGPPVKMTVTKIERSVPDEQPSEDGGFGEVLNDFINDVGAISGAIGALSGAADTQNTPTYSEPDYSGTTSSPLPQGVAGGSGSIGGQTFGSGNAYPSCGRHYVGLIRKSVCRLGGNIPSSSISSSEDPDPIANCWTPPC